MTENSPQSYKTAEATAVISNDIGWIKKSLSGIEETLKIMSGSFVSNETFEGLKKVANDLESRVNSLETERTRITVLLGVSGFILSTLIGLVVYHIFQK